MPRPLRYDLVDIPQHVVQRGNNRQRIFFVESDYRLYLDCLHEASRKNACEIHAYVLTSNHVHLLATPRRQKAIANVMQAVGRRYVRFINDRHQRSGTLWEARYRASLVASGSYLFNCYRYIELNPVRAAMVRCPGDYTWSSYRRNALGQPDVLITEHAEYSALAGEPARRRAAYMELFQGELDQATTEEIRRDLHQCRAFGPERFKEDVGSILQRSVKPAQRGRPRKGVKVSLTPFPDPISRISR